MDQHGPINEGAGRPGVTWSDDGDLRRAKLQGFLAHCHRQTTLDDLERGRAPLIALVKGSPGTECDENQAEELDLGKRQGVSIALDVRLFGPELGNCVRTFER
jgi:hypothetical protein